VAVASPPHGLGAHDRASLLSSKLTQPGKATLEGLGHGVIGIIMKALVNPERVHCWGKVRIFPSQPPKFGYARISNLMVRQSLCERVSVELWVSTRSRKSPNIDYKLNIHMPQQIDKFGDWPSRMTDSEERLRHSEGRGSYRICPANSPGGEFHSIAN
jgi:hypothetical protein